MCHNYIGNSNPSSSDNPDIMGYTPSYLSRAISHPPSKAILTENTIEFYIVGVYGGNQIILQFILPSLMKLDGVGPHWGLIGVRPFQTMELAKDCIMKEII